MATFGIGGGAASATNGDDVLVGSQGGETIEGRRGGDVLAGGPGDDRLLGNEGDDDLFGGPGSDRLEGGDGNDELEGGPGNDRLIGGNGDDALDGGRGDDRQSGDDGQDTFLYRLGDGSDRIDGGAGEDLLRVEGTAQPDGLALGSDGPGAGLLEPNDGSAPFRVEIANMETFVFNGGDGSDALSVQPGGVSEAGINTIIFNGGDGDDIFTIGDVDAHTIVNGGAGNDELAGSGTARVGRPGSYDDQLFGGDGNDTLRAFAGNDLLDGGAGDDTLDGDLHDDALFGGDGDDSLTGGAGFDRFFVSAGKDVIEDFEPDLDKIVARPQDDIEDIDVNADGVIDADDGPAVTIVGTDLVIDLGGGDTLTIRDETSLSASDFFF